MATLGAAALRPAAAAPAADPAAAIAVRSFAEALAALGGAPVPSARIALEIPDVADSGAVVPVTVSSALPDTREILILVDGNPQPVAVRFMVPAGTEPFVATRIRLAQSGTVHAAVRAGDSLFIASRDVKVAVGGCG